MLSSQICIKRVRLDAISLCQGSYAGSLWWIFDHERACIFLVPERLTHLTSLDSGVEKHAEGSLLACSRNNSTGFLMIRALPIISHPLMLSSGIH